MKRNWMRKIIGGISVTSALFVFQACYGTPQDFGVDFLLSGQVKSANTGLPISGIKVLAANNQFDVTDENGRFSFYTEFRDTVQIRFEDSKAELSGHFENCEKTLTNIGKSIYLEVDMIGKE